MNPECVTCRHLSRCATVTPDLILNHYVCSQWTGVREVEVQARCDVINQFGFSGLQSLIALRVEETNREED